MNKKLTILRKQTEVQASATASYAKTLCAMPQHIVTVGILTYTRWIRLT